MGCGTVQTLDTEQKQIKIQQNKEASQILDIKKDEQNISKDMNNKNKITQIKNKDSSKYTKKFPRKNKKLFSKSILSENSNITSDRKFRKIENYATVISAIQDSLPEINIKLDKTKDDIGIKFYEFEVKANRYEIVYPIWLIKNEEVEFFVEGKWKINQEIECDCNGIEMKDDTLFPDKVNEYHEKKDIIFNDGALVGRLLKGKSFLIYNGLKYTPEESGALLLKMNLNNIWSKEKPKGKLKIKLYGAYKIDDFEDLEKRNGWWKQLKRIEYLNDSDLEYYEMNDIEKSLIVLFNKLRHDSNIFAKQYLDNFQKITKTSKQIYDKFINNNLQFTPLKINLTLVKLLQIFFEKIFYKESTTEEDWNYVLSSENCLQEFLIDSFNHKKKIHACIVRYNTENIMHIFSRILFRKDIRDNILTYEYNEIGMITLFNNWNKIHDSDYENTKKSDVHYFIFALGNPFGNDEINHKVDSTYEKFIINEKIRQKLSLTKKSII